MTPLNLPRGSVRAIIVGLLVVGLAPVCIWAPSEGLAGYTGIAGFAIRDYFQVRQDETRAEGPPVPPPAL